MDPVGRPKSNNFGARFYLDFTKQSVVAIFCLWPQDKGIFPFLIDRDSAEFLPRLVTELNADSTITSRGMLGRPCQQ